MTDRICLLFVNSVTSSIWTKSVQTKESFEHACKILCVLQELPTTFWQIYFKILHSINPALHFKGLIWRNTPCENCKYRNAIPTRLPFLYVRALYSDSFYKHEPNVRKACIIAGLFHFKSRTIHSTRSPCFILFVFLDITKTQRRDRLR